MKLSVMHISDLHRDPENPIRNDVLLDSLENDRRHYTAEESPALRSPDLIIVSGDIIQGIRPDEPEPDKKFGLQYARRRSIFSASSPTASSAETGNGWSSFPGNHDVSAYHFFFC